MLFVFCGLTQMDAQEYTFETGFEGGPSVTFISNKYQRFSHIRPGIGFSAGSFIQLNLKNIVSLRTGFSFERKGEAFYKHIGNIYQDYGTVVVHNNYDYLIFNLLCRLGFGKQFGFFLQTGPFLGYLLHSRQVEGSNADFSGETYDRTDFFHRFDIGLASGIGIHYRILSALRLSLEFRYNMGFFQIVKEPYCSESDWYEKTNSINALLGLTYCFGHKKGKK